MQPPRLVAQRPAEILRLAERVERSEVGRQEPQLAHAADRQRHVAGDCRQSPRQQRCLAVFTQAFRDERGIAELELADLVDAVEHAL